MTSQGKPVTKIRVNGKDFFGTDVATAIKNLPADIIKNLQFVDDYGDQAKLTGIKTGEAEKILNLAIEEDKKKGYFARASAEQGNINRYNTNLRANRINGERQISIDGTAANANMRGGGGDGITTRNAIGLHYKNEFNRKVSADANYNYNDNKNNTISSTLTQNFLQGTQDGSRRLEDARVNSSKTNRSHWFGANVEYKIDSMNYLKITPNFSYNSNQENSAGTALITQKTLAIARESENLNIGNDLNLRINIFYHHKFLKKGRSLTGWSNFVYTDGENDRNSFNSYENSSPAGLDTLLQNQQNRQRNRNITLNAGLSYLEPLWNKSFLEVNYNWNRSATSNSRKTYNLVSGTRIFDASLSNLFDYEFITQNAGLNYRYIGESLNLTIGMNAQPTLLRGKNLDNSPENNNHNFNLIPSGRFSYKFSSQEYLDVNYWARNNQPGFLQLQPITDNSNLQNIITGNPNLKPEFIQSISAHYKQADWSAGKIIISNLTIQEIKL